MEMTPIASALQIVYQPHPLLPAANRVITEHPCDGAQTVREILVAQGIDPHSEIVISLNDRLLRVADWDSTYPAPNDIIAVRAVVSGGGGDSNPLRIIAMVVVSYFTMGAGATWASGLGQFAGAAAKMGAFMAGSALVNSIFPVSPPQRTDRGTAKAESPTYSLTGGSNRMRLYEPMPVVLGTHRIFPDYFSKPYSEFGGSDQYLYQIFNFGIGDYVIEDLRVGDTPITSFEDVEVTRAEASLDGFYSDVDQTAGAELDFDTGYVTRTSAPNTVKLAVDLEGAFYNAAGGGMAKRSADFGVQFRRMPGAGESMGQQIDVGDLGYAFPSGQQNITIGEWMNFVAGDVTETYTHYWAKGYYATQQTGGYYDENTGTTVGGTTSTTWKQTGFDTNLNPAAHTDGASAGTTTVRVGWANKTVDLIWRWMARGTAPRPKDLYTADGGNLTVSGASQKPLRLTLEHRVPAGTYEVRAWRISANETNAAMSSTLNWTTLRSYQDPNPAPDYTNLTVVGVRIKASGQLNGVLQQVSALAKNATAVWKDNDWALEYTVNPAWWYLHFARGIRDEDGRLLYGAGLTDEQIDIEGIKAWATFCDNESLTFSAVLDRQQTTNDVLQMIARCGLASPSQATGKLGVVWDARNQTPVAAFGMSNIIKGSFEVSYLTDKLADEIIVSYADENDNWQQKEERAVVPGTVGAPKRSQALDLQGCTRNTMAKKFANILAAQQVYRRRTVKWESDVEGFTCTRGDVVVLSHDLTQWGFSGRVTGVIDGAVLQLDRSVPTFSQTTYLMLKRPDGVMTTYTVVAMTDDEQDQYQDYCDPDYCMAYIEPSTGLVTLSSPPALQDGYEPHDHLWFYAPLETPGKKVKIISVQPISEYRVRITATDEDPAYYTAWDGTYTPAINPSLLTNDQPAINNVIFTETLVPTGNSHTVQMNIDLTVSGDYTGAALTAWVDDSRLVETSFTGTTYSLTVPDGGTFKVRLAPMNGVGQMGAEVTLTHTIIGTAALVAFETPDQISINPFSGGVSIMVDESTHRAFTGILVFASKTDGFTPDNLTNRVYRGPGNQAMFFSLKDGSALVPGDTIYLRLAYYGTGVTAAPVYSDQIAVTIPSSAKVLMLSSSSMVFKTDSAGANPAPASITLAAIMSGGLTGEATFSVTSGTATLVGTGNSRTLAYADLTTDAATITASITTDEGTFEDSVTVAKVKDGAATILGLLTNESHTLPADPSGTVTSYAGASTQMVIFIGDEDDSANWTFSRVNGAGVSSTLVGNICSVTGLSNDAGYIDITADRVGYASVTKRFSLSKAKQGQQGNSGSNGTNGNDGNPGTRGSITVYDSTNTTPSDALANAAIASVYASKVPGDTVIFSKSTSNRYYKWSGSAWTAANFFFDGNVIVNGTLHGDTLIANTINGNKIVGGTMTASVFSTTYGNGQLNMGVSSSSGVTIQADGADVFINVAKTSSTSPAGYFSGGGVGVYAQGPGSYGVESYGKTSSGGAGVRANGYAGAELTGVAYGAKISATGTYGVHGSGDLWDFYAAGVGGNYGPFTGAHDAFLSMAAVVQEGDIVVDVQVVARKNVSNTICKVTSSSVANQKGVIGIVAARRIPHPDFPPAAMSEQMDEYRNLALTHDMLVINAVGEGQINVCGEGGDLEIGDLIVTSSIPGKGMRQADDIVRSYTVAKCRERVVFDTPSEVRQVACIYLCG